MLGNTNMNNTSLHESFLVRNAPLFLSMMSYDNIRAYVKPKTRMTKQQQLHRAAIFCIFALLLLKRIYDKSPTLYHMIQTWAESYRQYTLLDLFSL